MPKAKVRPPHIEGKTYGTGCRCRHCTDFMSMLRAKNRRMKQEREQGKIFPTDVINSGRSRQLIRAALRRGMSMREIERLTGMNHETISRIRLGKRTQVWRSTESAIVRGLSDDYVRSLNPSSIVSKKKAVQIIYSLGAQGWTQEHLDYILENNTGYTGKIVMHTMRKGRPGIIKESEDRIKWLADTLRSATGPSTLTITRMRNRGFFPLVHYDVNGDLIESSLSREQKAILENVRS